MGRYSAVIFMYALALATMAAHLWIGWYVAIEEAAQHGTMATFSTYIDQWLRDTMENWQSEFVQLALQFAILAGLFAPLVKAHEEDQEDIKARLRRIEKKIEGETNA